MMIKGQFYHPKTIERKANELLVDFYKQEIKDIELPIKIDEIIELHLDLNVLWESFNNEEILAGLIPNQKTVVLNDQWAAKFKENEGLENFTKAHEVGHWELHVDKGSAESTPLPGFNRPYEIVCRNGDQSWDERNANRFAGCLLMPKEILLQKIPNGITNWHEIGQYAQLFHVSKAAVRVRLQELNMTYIDDDGTFYASKEEYAGQMQLV